MARVTALVFAALAALAGAARANEIEALERGEGELAVRLLSGGVRDGASTVYVRLLYTSIGRYIEGKGASDPENARALAGIAARSGRARLGSKDPEAVLLGAEGLLLLARQRVIAKDPAWLDAWREAARSLVPSEGAEAPWARVRAVEMLCEAVLQPGAPGETLLEEARALAPLGDGAPALAYRLGLARYELAVRKRKEAANSALEAFATIRPALEKEPSDIDRATIYNDAICFARRNRLALKGDLLLDPLDAASLSLALPRSRRWVVHQRSEFGAEVWQLAPNGLLRSEIEISNLQADVLARIDLGSSNSVRATAFFNGTRNQFGKIKRERKPATASLGGMKGVAYEVVGSSQNGCPRSAMGFTFRTRQGEEDSLGAIRRVAHGQDSDSDPDAEAFLDAVHHK